MIYKDIAKSTSSFHDRYFNIGQKIINVTMIHHVCRSIFYDTNGDMQWDLNGLKQKLAYPQNLGITAILQLPLYEADCYHNDFANDVEKKIPSLVPCKIIFHW